jgi:DTW domain-containing protein YfiP
MTEEIYSQMCMYPHTNERAKKKQVTHAGQETRGLIVTINGEWNRSGKRLGTCAVLRALRVLDIKGRLYVIDNQVAHKKLAHVCVMRLCALSIRTV